MVWKHMDKTSTLPNIERPPTLKQMAFDAIKDSIIKGNLKTGITYSEKTLAKELGIFEVPGQRSLNRFAAQRFYYDSSQDRI